MIFMNIVDLMALIAVETVIAFMITAVVAAVIYYYYVCHGCSDRCYYDN